MRHSKIGSFAELGETYACVIEDDAGWVLFGNLAEQALARAVRRDPRSFEGWANLAEVRRQRGDRRDEGREPPPQAGEIEPQEQEIEQHQTGEEAPDRLSATRKIVKSTAG